MLCILATHEATAFAQIRNPKLRPRPKGGDSEGEYPNPKQIQMTKIQMTETPNNFFRVFTFRAFENSDFVFVSCFGFRISNLSVKRSPVSLWLTKPEHILRRLQSAVLTGYRR